MLIEIWFTLFILSAFLIVIGYQYGAELTLIVGFGFMFLLGSALAFTGLEFENGSTDTTAYTYLPNSSTINQTVTTNQTTRETYKHTTMGLLLAVIGGLGAANIIYNGGKNR